MKTLKDMEWEEIAISEKYGTPMKIVRSETLRDSARQDLEEAVSRYVIAYIKEKFNL